MLENLTKVSLKVTCKKSLEEEEALPSEREHKIWEAGENNSPRNGRWKGLRQGRSCQVVLIEEQNPVREATKYPLGVGQIREALDHHG